MPSDTHSGSKSIWQAIGRPLLAYCAAALVAAFALLVLEPWFLGSKSDLDPRHLKSLLLFWPLAGLIIAVVAGLPTFLIAGFMFTTRIPRGIGEICTGAFIGFVGLCMVTGFRIHLMVSESLTFVVPGALAGLAYWLLVGRPRNRRLN